MKQTFATKTFAARTFRTATLAGSNISQSASTFRGAVFQPGAVAGQAFHAGTEKGQVR
jgi:hypothetical protein